MSTKLDVMKVFGVAAVIALPTMSHATTPGAGAQERPQSAQIAAYEAAAGDEKTGEDKKDKNEEKDKGGLAETPAALSDAGSESQKTR